MTDMDVVMRDALDMADFIAAIDDVPRPAFFDMSDARACALLMRDESGKQVYAREYRPVSNPLVHAYVVY
jgi:hypothetical protein